eukprot:6066325-Heterocapsa_arctica.AAC.1
MALARRRVRCAEPAAAEPAAVTAGGGTAPWTVGDNQWEGHHFRVDFGAPPFATLVAYLPGTTCESMRQNHI